MTDLLTRGNKGFYNLLIPDEKKIESHIKSHISKATSSSEYERGGFWNELLESLRNYGKEPIHASSVVPFCATHDIIVKDNIKDVARLVNTFFLEAEVYGMNGAKSEDEEVRYVLVQDLKFKPGSMLHYPSFSGKAQMFL